MVWAYGVGVIGLYFLHQCSSQCSPQRLALLQGLLGVWSIRLGHICSGDAKVNRKMSVTLIFGTTLDQRLTLVSLFFSKCRHFGSYFLPALFLILVRNQTELQVWDHLGLIIWVCGFVGVSPLGQATECLQTGHRSNSQGGGVRNRVVEILRASQLFLRVGPLVGLSPDGPSFSRRHLVACPASGFSLSFSPK